MEIFEIGINTEIVEPLSEGDVRPIIYLGQKYLALMSGHIMPKGSRELRSVDWKNNPDVKKDIIEQMISVVRLEDMSEDERSIYLELVQPSVEKQKAELVSAIHKEISRRIHRYASLNTQMNAAAFAAGNLLEPDRMKLFRKSMKWIEEMRIAGKKLIDEQDTAFDDDEKWPPISDEVVDFMAQF